MGVSFRAAKDARECAPRHRKLSRAISDAGWSKFKAMLAAKCDKYGRDLTIVDRWFASSQLCSCCGQSGGKKAVRPRVADRRLSRAPIWTSPAPCSGQGNAHQERVKHS